ncbi:probable serine/threonine-protein kinase DDB_G0283337 isoform X3 [Daktulosphaira vitifoliae]|uniref:probable serine/threonine-protein kinase DDB_G0283337 isoform X3 n=1 Tax=Daktulosphaira vitifoliae TaxID=58002 RepID=UPI0021AA8FBE|nr:probable serine/threonine-protein kinase DDB_G0283337 isoform X3 [Daktulosphaira vitifoliae]
MSTNRQNWLLRKQNKIYNSRFPIESYKAGNMKRLKSNTGSLTVPFSDFKRKKKNVFSSKNYNYDTSDIEFSDINTINTSECFDTPNCSDVNSSESDSKSFSSLDSDISSLTEDSEDFEVSLMNNKNITTQFNEIDLVSLSSSSSTTLNNIKCNSSQECAVVLCNQKARNHFDKLFYINFPLENEELCKQWWTLCNQKSNFNSNAKICSIHFDDSDFITSIVEKNSKRYRQTILKNETVIPQLYLLPEEYLKLSRKHKKHNEIYNAYDVKNQLAEDTIKCSIDSCKKMLPKDSKNAIFFKYPLNNKPKLKMWMRSLKMPNWKPNESDYICSNHFEKYQLEKKDNGYELSQYAIPSINVKKPFVLSSKIDRNKCDVKNNNIPIKQSNIRVTFNQVSSDCLMVNEETVDFEKMNDNNKNLKNINAVGKIENKINDNGAEVDSKNNLVNNTLQSFFDSFAQTLIPSDSLKSSNDKEEDLEYVYLDILDGNNEVQERDEKLNSAVESIINHNMDIENVKDFELEENNISHVDFTIDPLDMVQECVIETTINDPFIESRDEYLVQVCEKNVMNNITTIQLSSPEKCLENENSSKSTNSEQDYVYLDMLNSDNVGNLPPQICSTPVRQEILELHKEINPKNIPESIIYDKNLGESYGEMLPHSCDSSCQLICYFKIPEPERVKIYKKFHLLSCITEQNCEIAQWLKVRMVKKTNGAFDCCPIYRLLKDKEFVHVCRSFFLNTLGITEQRLDSILNPVNYNWYYNKETALKANKPFEVNVINESTIITKFMKESFSMLDKDYYMFIPDHQLDVLLDEVPRNEYENVISYIQNIPRVLTSHYKIEEKCKIFFETSINVEYMYKSYSEKYLLNKKPPPYTKRQFIKIYNQYMKKFI